MLYQVNYEAKVRLTSSLSVMNALSTELWSKSTSHILALHHEYSINWTKKQKYVSHPRSPSWMLYQLNYDAKVCLTSTLSVINALSTELWSKSMSHNLALSLEYSINWTMKQKYVSHPRSPSWMLYQLNFEAKTHLTSSLSVMNVLPTELWSKNTLTSSLSIMNALSTQLWSKNTSHILALRQCSINWTLKQKYVSHPRSLSWMLYQLNYEAKTHLTSSLSVMNALSTELWSKNTSHILALRHECSINWTLKQQYVSHPRSPS